MLIVAADERITPELQRETCEAIRRPDVDGFNVNRRFWFLDGWINHCGYFWNSNRAQALAKEALDAGSIPPELALPLPYLLGNRVFVTATADWCSVVCSPGTNE